MLYALCSMLHALSAMSYELVCFLSFTLYSLPHALCTMPFTLCAMRHAPCSMRVALFTFGRFLSPVKEDGMMAPRNAYPACPVGSGNPTGVESFLLLSRSLPSSGFRPRNSEMRHAPCAMLAIPLGLEVHRQSGGFTLWNACPVKCRSDFTGAELCHSTGAKDID